MRHRTTGWRAWAAIAALGCGAALGACPDDGDDGDDDTAAQADPGTGGDPGPAFDAGPLPDLGPDAPGPASVWRPAPRTTWQWQLSGTIDTSFDVAMYDIDLFDVPAVTIAALKTDGRVVICYLSAGSYEDWRDDAADFPAAALGKPLDGWPGEKWLDVRDATVRQIMAKRLDLAVTKGCDGVEPDNVDGYDNDTGLTFTQADQLAYNRWFAGQAHARGLSVGLKNALALIPQLVDAYDWALNEECAAFDECDLLTPFITAGKAVFHVEYGAASLAASVCPKTQPLQFSTLIKNLELDAWLQACTGP